MPLLGEHESINESPYKALYRAKKKGFEVIQIFTRHRLRWSAKGLTNDEISLFSRARKETGVIPVSIHGSYLLIPVMFLQQVMISQAKKIMDKLLKILIILSG